MRYADLLLHTIVGASRPPSRRYWLLDVLHDGLWALLILSVFLA